MLVNHIAKKTLNLTNLLSLKSTNYLSLKSKEVLKLKSQNYFLRTR